MSGFVERGVAAVRAAHPATRRRIHADHVSEEELADVIADVLHLAVAAELDPDEVLEHGRRYFTGDLEEDLP